jgi:hypothetical protein
MTGWVEVILDSARVGFHTVTTEWPFEVSLYLLLAFVTFTVYAENRIHKDPIFKHSRKFRTLWAFKIVLMSLNASMCAFGYFSLSEYDHNAQPTVEEHRLISTFKKINQDSFDLISAACFDSSFMSYELLVVSIWALYCNQFCSDCLHPWIKVLCGGFINMCENNAAHLSNIGFSLDMIDREYQLDPTSIIRRDVYPNIVLKYVRLAAVAVWSMYTTYAFAALDSDDDFLFSAVLGAFFVIHGDTFFGIWNPVTLFYELFDADSKICPSDVLFVLCKIGSIGRTSFAMMNMQYKDSNRIHSLIQKNNLTILSNVFSMGAPMCWAGVKAAFSV